MLNKIEKQKIVECTKDLYKLIAELSMASDYEEAALVKKVADALEGLLDD